MSAIYLGNEVNSIIMDKKWFDKEMSRPSPHQDRSGGRKKGKVNDMASAGSMSKFYDKTNELSQMLSVAVRVGKARRDEPVTSNDFTYKKSQFFVNRHQSHALKDEELFIAGQKALSYNRQP